MLVVELGSRVNDVISHYRANFQSYVPLHTVECVATAFLILLRLRDWSIVRYVENSVKPKCEICEIKSRLKRKSYGVS